MRTPLRATFPRPNGILTRALTFLTGRKQARPESPSSHRRQDRVRTRERRLPPVFHGRRDHDAVAPNPGLRPGSGMADGAVHSATHDPVARGQALVAGHVPDRCRLLLDLGLPARYRGAGRRRTLADRHPGARRGHAARSATCVPTGRRREPTRAGIDRDARTPAPVLEGQALRPGAARLRRHRLRDHDDPLGRRRRRPRDREPLRAVLPARPGAVDHAGSARTAGRRLPPRLHRGHRHRCGARRGLPAAEHRRARGLALAGARPSGPGAGLGSGPHPGTWKPRDDGRRRADGLSAAGTRALRVRDRCRGDASRPRGRGRQRGAAASAASAAPSGCSRRPQ